MPADPSGLAACDSERREAVREAARLRAALEQVVTETSGSDYVQQWPIRSLQDAVVAAHRIAKSALSESEASDG